MTCLDIFVFILERDLLHAANVGKHSLKGVAWVNIFVFILGRSLLHAANVIRSLLEGIPLLDIFVFILERNPSHAANVGRRFLVKISWLTTFVPILERSPLYATNVGRPILTKLAWQPIVVIILGKTLQPLRNGICWKRSLDQTSSLFWKEAVKSSFISNIAVVVVVVVFGWLMKFKMLHRDFIYSSTWSASVDMLGGLSLTTIFTIN